MGNYDFPYLDVEDAAFSRAMRLTEDQFLQMAGGLKKYTEFRINRSKARGATIENSIGEKTTFDVPRLPSTTQDAMALIKVPGTKEEDFAEYLLKDQMNTVQGIVDALRANRAIKEDSERVGQERASMKERNLHELRQEAAGAYGFAPESQSARDYAAQKYQERYASKRGW